MCNTGMAYSLETVLSLISKQQHRLQVHQNNWVLRVDVAGVKRVDRRKMDDLREELGMMKSLIKWAGHVKRMDGDHLPKKGCMCITEGWRRGGGGGEEEGHRRRGGGGGGGRGGGGGEEEGHRRRGGGKGGGRGGEVGGEEGAGRRRKRRRREGRRSREGRRMRRGRGEVGGEEGGREEEEEEEEGGEEE